MRKVTTTKQIHKALSRNLLQVIKVEMRHKSSKQVDVLSENILIESLEFLLETIFANMIDWHYERNFNADREYIFDSGCMNSYSEDIVIVYLRVGEGVDEEDLEKILLFEEE